MAKLLGSGSRWGSTVLGAGTCGGDYELPACLVLSDNNVDTKTETWSLSFSDGSFSAGDEIKDRKATLTGTFGQMTRSAFRTLCDELRYECSKPGLRLQLVAGGPYLNLSHMVSFDEDPEQLFDWSVAKIRVSWQCDDPFWYAITPEVRTFALSGSGSFRINAGLSAGLKGCNRGVFPLIQVTSPAFLPVPSFTLQNVSDDGLQLRYSDPYIKNGNSAFIDCARGVSYRDDGANSVRFLEGEFLRLLTKTNNFVYDGPACTLTFTWVPRWL